MEDDVTVTTSFECHLLDIPSEIRVLVYQYLFNLDRWQIPRLRGAYKYPAGCCNVNLHNGRIYTQRQWGEYSFKKFPAILRTCRLIHKEARDVLFEQTMFLVRVSDEQYNRRMRPYSTLRECAFLSRIQQVYIKADTRQHDALLAMPDTLNDLFGMLTCPASKITVEFEPTSGSLFAYLPNITPAEVEAEEKAWQEFLRRLSALKGRCSFVVNKPSLRNNVRQRLDQVVQAVEDE